MAFWLLKKKTDTNKTEQIRERAKLLNIIVLRVMDQHWEEAAPLTQLLRVMDQHWVSAKPAAMSEKPIWHFEV